MNSGFRTIIIYLSWLASTLLVLLVDKGATNEVGLRPEVIKLGAIFTLKTVNGPVSKIAIEAAEKDVNSDPRILGGRKLSITIHDSNFSGFRGFIGGTSCTCTCTCIVSLIL